jgi:hypothetical protein
LLGILRVRHRATDADREQFVLDAARPQPGFAYSQGLELVHRQSLDAGGRDFAQGAAAAVEQPEGHLGLFAKELTSRSPIPEQDGPMTTASTDTPSIRDCLERIAEYIEPGEIVNLNRVWRTV